MVGGTWAVTAVGAGTGVANDGVRAGVGVAKGVDTGAGIGMGID